MTVLRDPRDGRMDAIERDIATMRDSLGALRTDLSAIRVDMAEIKGRLEHIPAASDVAEIKGRMQNIPSAWMFWVAFFTLIIPLYALALRGLGT